MYSYSADSGYTCSTPYQAVSDGRDAMVVVGLNGEPLADARGYPARMLVPGLFGFVSATKWLERIEFTTYAAADRLLDRAGLGDRRPGADPEPDRRPEVPRHAPAPTSPVLAGVAWAQHRGIEKVEVRIDDGPWQEATLAATAASTSGGSGASSTTAPPACTPPQVRATDLDGRTQPEARTKVFPDGARGWHQIQFTSVTPGPPGRARRPPRENLQCTRSLCARQGTVTLPDVPGEGRAAPTETPGAAPPDSQSPCPLPDMSAGGHHQRLKRREDAA